ncbi:hypothetical protein DR64_7260 [Paraburkholderia xenovorans LB400]|jgi:hypothetical protein|nr:hypothetical protein DR64_7260 [Paraburkholderia xenovorans LB400]
MIFPAATRAAVFHTDLPGGLSGIQVADFHMFRNRGISSGNQTWL